MPRKRQSNSFVLTAKARNGTDGAGTERVYIRSKRDTPPYVNDNEDPVGGGDSNGKYSDDDGYLPSVGVDSGEVETNDWESRPWGEIMGEIVEYGECVPSPKGVSQTWPYEWVLERKLGTPNAQGKRSWEDYEGAMSLHERWARDAETYEIVFTEAWAKVSTSDSITARLRGYAYKVKGDTRTPLVGATIRYGYIIDDSDTYATTTTNNRGYFSEDEWFDNDNIGPNGYNKGSKTVFAAIVVGFNVVCAEHVLMVKDAEPGGQGATGKMCYIAGPYSNSVGYTSNSRQTVAVEVENTTTHKTELWYLTAATNVVNGVHIAPTDSNQSVWEKGLNEYNLIRTKYLFADFAQLGAGVVTGDWFISCHGTIGGVYLGGTVENPDFYNGRAAYTYFDPSYPQGFGIIGLPVINEEIDRTYSSSWTRITNNFKLVAGTYKFRITCRVNSSNTMQLRLFYGDNTGNDYYLGNTTNEDIVTLEFTKTLAISRNDWNLRAGMSEAGEIGYIVSVEIDLADDRFVPNYALDFKTGRTYQNDAHIKGALTAVGPNSKIVISDGIIEFFGTLNFPNIVLGVDADGCAVFNFYDKNGNFKYGLGPEKIFENKSQSEAMTLRYYNVDEGSDDVTGLLTSDYVWLYKYMFKNETPDVSRGLYKYLAKIVSGVYGPGNYCASQADAQTYNERIIKYGYSSNIKLRSQDLFSGGVVVTSSRTQSGVITRLSSILNGTSVYELDNRGYNVLQDNDFNRTLNGQLFEYKTKGTNSVRVFYYDTSTSNGNVGYDTGYTGEWYLNLCVDPTDTSDDILIDPIYWFNLIVIDNKGQSTVNKTLYINESKLRTILENSGYTL